MDDINFVEDAYEYRGKFFDIDTVEFALRLHSGANLSKEEIHECIVDEQWQRIRVSMKGDSTWSKLCTLAEYLDDRDTTLDRYGKDVVVTNYINALARGGQLPPISRMV